MAQPIMNALDAIAGSQASAYVTMADGNRYCFMQLYSFESKMDISVAEVPILGKSGKGNSRPAGPARGAAPPTTTSPFSVKCSLSISVPALCLRSIFRSRTKTRPLPLVVRLSS